MAPKNMIVFRMKMNLRKIRKKVEMEKATNSKIEFIKSLETENVHSSLTEDMTNTSISDIKKVMEWLLDGKEVVYHLIGGESEEWVRLDPEKPILDGGLYQYQLAENTKSKWNFRIPEYSLEASSREDALQKAYNLIVKNPSYIVVYPEEIDV